MAVKGVIEYSMNIFMMLRIAKDNFPDSQDPELKVRYYYCKNKDEFKFLEKKVM